DAVEGGASVNFLAGVTVAEAAAWWSERLAQVADGTITVSGAREPPDAPCIGPRTLIGPRNPNAPHRAEIGKVIVHRSARRRGPRRDLMAGAEVSPPPVGPVLAILPP